MQLNRAELLELLPHADPFVFLDRAEVGPDGARGAYTISGEECFIAGHFPGRPIFPATIMVEAIGQLGIAYMMRSMATEAIDPESIYFIKSEELACSRKCLPGDTLDMEIQVLRVREPIIQFSGKITVGGELALKVSSVSLSFSTRPKS